MNNPLASKENEEYDLHFPFLSRLFTVCPEPSMPFKYPCTAHALFPERMPNHYKSLRRASSEICKTFDAHSLSDPSRNHINDMK
jgi:hypothetical protein